jgi:hypothetical protein
LKDCPTCQSKQIISSPLFEEFQRIDQERQQILIDVPMIPIGQLVRSSSYPDATGSYADIYHCQWNVGTQVKASLNWISLKKNMLLIFDSHFGMSFAAEEQEFG